MATDEFHSPWFRRGTIISATGYRVVLFERFRLRYEENASLVLIYAYEAIPGKIMIYHDTPPKDSHGNAVMLSAEDDARVMNHVRRALEWRGFDVTIFDHQEDAYAV